MSRLDVSRSMVWSILALPLVAMTAGYVTGRLFYGEVVHISGELSVRLMMLALAVTPLVLMFPGRGFTRWLLRHRRAFGVASFAYAAFHTIVYLQRQPALADILEDGMTAGYATGWLALLIFTALAATSNDASVRRLKRAWRSLHRFVYAAAVLTFIHWLLVAFDPVPAWIHIAILGALETVRVWKRRRIRHS